MSPRVFYRNDASQLGYGRLVNPLDMVPSDINFEAMFWTLSGVNRFNGSIEDHWSVSHHLLLCDRIAIRLNYSPEMRLHLIVHDLHESWLGDVPTPVKELFGRFTIEQAERAVDKVIYQAIGIEGLEVPIGPVKKEVKDVDTLSLINEAEFFEIDLGYSGDTSFTNEIESIQGLVGNTNYKETRQNLKKELTFLFHNLCSRVAQQAVDTSREFHYPPSQSMF